MRSRSGPGIVSATLAVAMKTTCDRSSSTSRQWSRNEWFCAGSRTSSSAALGSPRQSAPTLSTSSSMITGFIVPASRRARTRRPGSAPMYVRRWPRTSASSRTPPSDMRTNSRSVARAIEPLLRALRPRHRDQPVEVAADHRRLARLLAHSLEPAELALRLLADVVGHPGLVDLGAVLLDHRA